MRLTNSHKQAFVTAVLQDIPKVEYYETIAETIRNYAASILPKELKAIHDNKELRDYLNTGRVYINNVGSMYYKGLDDLALPSEVMLEIQELSDLSRAQERARDEMREKLRAVINGCSTREKAVQLLPEFEKYLPNEAAEVTKGVPMITDLVTSLTSLGWPKDKQNSTAVAA